jgi:hypothetical protein
MDTAICDASGKPIIIDYSKRNILKQLSAFAFVHGPAFVGKTTAMKAWVKKLQDDGEYAVYISLSDCKDGRYHDHLRNSIIPPLPNYSSAHKLSLGERIDDVIQLHNKYPYNKVTLVIDDAHLAKNAKTLFKDLYCHVEEKSVRVVFVSDLDNGNFINKSDYKDDWDCPLRYAHTVKYDQHHDQEFILHTLKRRMNIDEPHLDQIVSAVGVSLKDIDAVMHKVRKLMPAGSSATARPTTAVVSAAIDDVLKTRYQEIRAVVDSVPCPTGENVDTFKDRIFGYLSRLSSDEKTEYNDRRPSNANVNSFVRSALNENKLNFRTVPRDIYDGDRTIWERDVYATAFNKYFDPAVELPVTANAATTDSE